jgi:hypothetical protein
MCTSAPPDAPKAPIIPESVKRVSKDQRRTVADNNANQAAAASATQTAGQGLLPNATTGQKKTLLGL